MTAADVQRWSYWLNEAHAETERLREANRLLRRKKYSRRHRRCVYCGHWGVGRTCVDHADLPKLDPFYSEKAA